jgi:hypothetical protein
MGQLSDDELGALVRRLPELLGNVKTEDDAAWRHVQLRVSIDNKKPVWRIFSILQYMDEGSATPEEAIQKALDKRLGENAVKDGWK